MSKKIKLSILIIVALALCILFFKPNISLASNQIMIDNNNFPDEKFRNVLKDTFSDYLQDNILTQDEIEKITSLDISFQGISNLKGIEFLTELKYLNAEANNIEILDLSNNINLKTLELSNNQLLKSLELPQSIENIYLNFNTKLNKVDLSSLSNLKLLYAVDVPLNSLDVRGLTKLISLNIENTNIKEIDLSNNLNLEYLNVANNNIQELDIRSNINLVTLDLVNNKLSKIELPNSIRKNTSIEFFNQQVQEGYEVEWYVNDTKIDENSKVLLEGQTLTSKIKAKTYTIVFNANAGKGTMANQVVTFNEANNLLENNFSRIGYTFEGWTTNSNSTEIKYVNKGEIKITKYPSSGKIILYAVWKPIKYTVEFDANGGNGSMVSIENILYGTTFKLPTNQFTKEGYNFIGWTNSKTSSIIRYFDKQTVSNLVSTEGQSIKLYAVWEKKEYNINFNIDGKITNTKVSYKNKLNIPNTPIKKGYTFIGWYDEKTNEKYDFNNQVTESISLVAKFKINSYNVVLNGNGHTRNSIGTFKLNYNESTILPANTYIKDGYEFIGWSLTPNGAVVYSDKSVIKNLSSIDNDTVNLYAQWKLTKKDFAIKVENKNVTYNGKAQTISISNVPVGSKIEYRTSKNASWSTVKPTRTSIGTTTVYYRITNEEYNTFEGSGTITINAKQIKNLNINNIANKTYTGKQIKPGVTAKDGNIILKSGVDYTLSYGTNKNTGKAYVKIIGKGNYTGTITKYFYIVPKKPTVSISAGKSSFNITAKSTGADGYEILYSTTKNGNYKISRTSKNKVRVNRLVKGKKYYVKVRAYKVIDGKRVYSGYSSIKMIKIK